MLCEQCKKNVATTHVHTVINGVVTDKNLCGDCAASGGYTAFGENGIIDMMASMFVESLNHNSLKNGLRCDCCNASFSDIAKTGKAGCANCYKVFSEEFLPSLHRLHGKTNHIGKIPGKNTGKTDEFNKVSKLKELLKAAVEAEDYEQAAKLRDEIKLFQEGD